MVILTDVDLWGSPFEQYLRSQHYIGSFTSLEQLQASITALEDPTSVTCSTLEHILSVTSYPHELLVLDSTKLTRISFDLLQNYMKSNSVSELSKCICAGQH